MPSVSEGLIEAMPPRFGGLELQRFRAFRDMRIDGLGRVNLITGRNNTGKSSVLALRMPRRILLVEGVDDEHVMKHICGNHGIPHLDEIKEHGGAPNLLESVPVRIKASEEGDVVGIVIDADTDMDARWRSIRDRITTMGYENTPQAPTPEGTIIDPPERTLLPRLGIWIMPNNRTDGILESFLRFLVPQPSALLEYVEKSVSDIPDGEPPTH